MKKENKVKDNLQKWADSQHLCRADMEFVQFIIDADFIWKYRDRKAVIERFINIPSPSLFIDN